MKTFKLFSDFFGLKPYISKCGVSGIGSLKSTSSESILHSDDALKTLFPKALVLFIKEVKIWNNWLHHLEKKHSNNAVLQVVIIVIIARITWNLIKPLFVQSLVSLTL